MMNTRLLKARMCLYGDTQLSLANFLKLSATRLNAKLNETNGAEFTAAEIRAIADRYELDANEISTIFFADLGNF